MQNLQGRALMAADFGNLAFEVADYNSGAYLDLSEVKTSATEPNYQNSIVVCYGPDATWFDSAFGSPVDQGAGMSLKDGVLTVNGTAAADEISLDYTANGQAVTATVFDDQGRLLSKGSFLVSDLQHVEVNAGGGDDVVRNNTSLYAIIRGGAGNDQIFGGDGWDDVYGGEGNDLIDGGGDWDILYGEDGDDDIYGGEGDDDIYGGAGYNVLYGNAGHDEIFGGDDWDDIYGGTGNDYLDGGDDWDILFGEDGDDTLIGGGGDDELYGGAGDNQLHDVDVFEAAAWTTAVSTTSEGDSGGGWTGPMASSTSVVSTANDGGSNGATSSPSFTVSGSTQGEVGNANGSFTVDTLGTTIEVDSDFSDGEVSAEAKAYLLELTAKGSAETKTVQLGGVDVKAGVNGEVVITVGVFAKADAAVGIDGLTANAAVGAGQTIELSGETYVNVGDLTLGADGEAEIFLGTTAEGSANFNKDGLNVGGEAFAGEKFAASGTGSVGGLGAGGSAEGWVGAGLKLDGSAQFVDGKLQFDFEIGAALGIGGKLGLEVEIDVEEIKEDFEAFGKGTADAFTDLFDGFETAGDEVAAFFEDAAETVKAGVEEAAQEVAQFAQEVGQTVSNGVQQAANEVADFAENAVNQASQEVSKVAAVVAQAPVVNPVVQVVQAVFGWLPW